MKRTGVIILFFLASCGVFNRSAKTTSKSFDKSSAEQTLQLNSGKRSNLDAYQLRLHNDSSETAYRIQFWPKGMINFTADGGFAGSFDSVLVTGNQRRQGKSTLMSRTHLQEEQSASAHLEDKMQQNSGIKKEEKVSTPDWNMIAGFLIIIISVIFMVVKKGFLAGK